MRLAKYLAAGGVASRRASEALVRAGRVTIDGVMIDDPARNVGDADAVAIDGAPVRPVTEPVVYALNKPAGVVSTASDPQGRPTVVSLLSGSRGSARPASGARGSARPAPPGRLYPVGRLDIDTTGLILLTNDGDLAYRLTHPRFEVPKTYRAVVANPPVRARALHALRAGVRLDDGVTAPARVRRVSDSVLELTLREGRKRQIKRMCEAVGHPVRHLQRVAFGPLALGDLPVGAWRRLREDEVQALAGAGRPGRRSGRCG